MTITLTPELEKAVTQVAQERGTTPEQVALETLKAGLAIQTEAISGQENLRRKERIYAIMGSSSHLGPSHLQESKEEEKQREERN